MTNAEQVSILEYMRAQFASVEREIRGVHHRLDEMQAANSKEHGQVMGLFNDGVVRVTSIETRVDLLESDRDRKIGAEDATHRVRTFLAGVVIACAGALASAFATGFIST
jgi:hypothetical protein